MQPAPSWRVLPAGLPERLVGSAEPAARWVALTSLLRRPADDAEVLAAHETVLADPATEDLLQRLIPWETENPISGHHRPEYAPNLLGLLLDRGVGPSDDERIARCLGSMLEHQAADGRLLALGRGPGMSEPVWAALPCDTHAIAEVLARTGHGPDPRLRATFDRMERDLAETAQGHGWLCLPDPALSFRGPGRKGDICPQVSLQALRAFSYLPEPARPAGLLDAARTILAVWRGRGSAQPHLFGHGRSFKRVKWPDTWYSSLAVVDTIGRYPEVWVGPGSNLADRQSVAEIAACLRAYNMASDGTVLPRSVTKGYQAQSFGQKKALSDFAAARIASAVVRLEPISDEIAAVDVLALASSRGGTGTALPP